MRYFASARLSIRHKANRTLVYQSRLSTPRWLSAEIFNARVSQHRDSLHGCGLIYLFKLWHSAKSFFHAVATGMRAEAALVIVGLQNDG